MKKLLFAIVALLQFTFSSCTEDESEITKSIYCACKYGSLGHDASFFLYEEGDYVSFTAPIYESVWSMPATTINGEKKECLRYTYYNPKDYEAAEMKLVPPGRYVLVCNPKNNIFLVYHLVIDKEDEFLYFECDVNKALNDYYSSKDMIILDWVTSERLY